MEVNNSESLVTWFLQNAPTIWITAGVILSILEFFIPGILVVFFGIGAILTGITAYFFAIGLSTQIMIWLTSSMALLLTGGQVLKKMFPSSESFQPPTDFDYYDREVKVVKKILVNKKGGRVSFQGTEWDAISFDAEIPRGKKARILSRDNLTFVVISASKNPEN